MNQAVAEKLRQAADLLAQQGANPFRRSAYRRAADAVGREDRDLGELLDRTGAGVTETQGPLAGQRVVRRRGAECGARSGGRARARAGDEAPRADPVATASA